MLEMPTRCKPARVAAWARTAGSRGASPTPPKRRRRPVVTPAPSRAAERKGGEGDEQPRQGWGERTTGGARRRSTSHDDDNDDLRSVVSGDALVPRAAVAVQLDVGEPESV